jgi:hypothetical protein
MMMVRTRPRRRRAGADEADAAVEAARATARIATWLDVLVRDHAMSWNANHDDQRGTHRNRTNPIWLCDLRVFCVVRWDLFLFLRHAPGD